MKYDWRLRDVNNSTTDTALIGRLVNEYNKYCSFLTKSGTPTITVLSAANYSKVVYVHAELGDDVNGDGTPDNPYKSFAGGVSNADNPINSSTIVVAIGNFDSDLNVSNALIVADTFGCVVINSNATVQSIHVGCYISTTAQLGGTRYCNCIVDCNGVSTLTQLSLIHMKTIFINGTFDFRSNVNANVYLVNCTFINVTFKCSAGYQNASVNYYDNVFVNSFINLAGITESMKMNVSHNFLYNSTIQSGDYDSKFGAVDIREDGGYSSLSDCFVDPSHLNFDLKRSAMSNPIFANWIGWTGDSVNFVRVVGDNVQEDSGSWTIDQQTPGRFSLESAIIDNRGQFNQVFTGLATNVFHYATNEISIAPFERFGTPVVLASGDSSLTVSETTMYCVTQDCEIAGTHINRYQNVILEAGSYAVTEHNGVKFFPYNYNSINNYILVRFTNFGRCTSVAANSTLKIGCSYLNQTGSVVTISNGTEVAAGGTFICDTANLTANGALLKVFDDEVNNWVPIPTHSFQTKYKAGYVVTNKKYQPATNLLDFDGKTMPLTEAFGEHNDVNYLDSLNWQQDLLQFKVCGVVYDFS
jgi:hypothetical protein